MITAERILGRLRVAAVCVLVATMLLLARPSPRDLALGLPLVALGEALRIWAAGHLVKNRELIVSGPYRHTRNPLYLGRLAIFTGLALAAAEPHGFHWFVLAAGWAVFFGYYLPRKERVEPGRLLAIHGESFERYRIAVPALFPRPRAWEGGSPAPWSARRMVANHEPWMILVLAAVASYLIGSTWFAPTG